MNALLGQGLVLVALGCAGFAAAAGLWAGLRGRASLHGAVRVAAAGFAVCTLLAGAVLWWALITHDFSLRYVARVTSLDAPLHVAVSSLWSAYEGSLLFWALVLGLYLLVFLRLEREAEARLSMVVLGTASATGAFFLLLVAGPASPFRSLSPVPADGQGTAPLLQDNLLMLIHPPALYGGQTGLVIPLGIALAALAQGDFGPELRAAMRRWLLAAWVLLTFGIVLGAWWAYRVLGWGGYWAWDPVENASLVPWLIATALLHVLRVVERRRAVEALALALAVGAYCSMLLGVFATRSGSVSSVHAFARSSAGPVFLVPPALALLGSVALAVLGRRQRRAAGRSFWQPSRALAALLGSLVLVGFALAVLLATAYPLLAAALDGSRVGVGRGYFDRLAVPFTALAVFLMGVAPALPWGATEARVWVRKFAVPGGLGLGTAAACVGAGIHHGGAVLLFALAAFAASATLPELALSSAALLGWRARRAAGAWLCHLGALVALVAIGASSALSTHVEVTALPGESFEVGRHRVRFDGLSTHEEAHRRWVAAELTVIDSASGERKFDVATGARLTFYPRREQPISKPMVSSTAAGDVYVTLGGFDPETKRAGFAAWEFPLVGWLWGSLPLMAFGALLALSARRGGVPRPRLASPPALTCVTAARSDRG